MGTSSTSGSGDGDADDGVATLFAEERVAMTRMATLLVGSRSVAEEVVQDAFVSIGPHWSSIDRPGAYLRTTVVRGCAAVLRRRDVEARHAARLADADPVELPTHLVELRDALDRLSERQRIVIVLRYLVDLPDTEIAEVLAVRPATVRSIAHRALAVLRKELS